MDDLFLVNATQGKKASTKDHQLKYAHLLFLVGTTGAHRTILTQTNKVISYLSSD
jgi:hypothetical protein